MITFPPPIGPLAGERLVTLGGVEATYVNWPRAPMFAVSTPFWQGNGAGLGGQNTTVTGTEPAGCGGDCTVISVVPFSETVPSGATTVPKRTKNGSLKFWPLMRTSVPPLVGPVAVGHEAVQVAFSTAVTMAVPL